MVSSTRIRRLLNEGRVDEAGALLGHQYYLEGRVVQRSPKPRIQLGQSRHDRLGHVLSAVGAKAPARGGGGASWSDGHSCVRPPEKLE